MLRGHRNMGPRMHSELRDANRNLTVQRRAGGAPPDLSSLASARPLHDARTLEALLEVAGIEGSAAVSARILGAFGDLAGALAASPSRLARVGGVSGRTVRLLGLVREASTILGRASVLDVPVLSKRSEVVSYCRMTMGREPREHVRLLNLGADNRLLSEEILSIGTLGRATIHVREIVRSALEANAAACLLVHNHPDASTKPSDADVIATREARRALAMVEVTLHLSS